MYIAEGNESFDDCAYHLARNQIRADAEVFKWALGLSSPKPIGWDFDFAERVFLDSNICIIQSVVLSQLPSA